MRRKARETDRCRAGEIQIFALMPGGSAAAPFNNNLYYFNDLRPRSPPPLFGDLVRAKLRRAAFERLGDRVSSDRHWPPLPRGVITFPCFSIESQANFLFSFSFEGRTVIPLRDECARDKIKRRRWS